MKKFEIMFITLHTLFPIYFVKHNTLPLVNQQMFMDLDLENNFIKLH